jgi:hypothetical protein
MRNANLTRHAELRLGERCKLSPEKLKHLVDHGVTIPVALQKGGRHAKRLLYSSPDQAWFIIVQDADDGGILTVMPLDYLKHRIAVTAAQRRSARSRVHAFENPRVTRTTCSPVASPTPENSVDNAVAPPPMSKPASAANGWKVRVCYTVHGATRYKNLPRTHPEHGDPADWTAPGLVHTWLRECLIEAGITFRSVEHVTAERKGLSTSADCLLEHLPLTHEEIEACR